jgi:ABC-type branched-subunit amino acid transport system ATPase component
MSVALQARGLAAGYHGHAIVDGLDLSLEAGTVTALLGPNGAGKSTTLLTLAGALTPLGGEVSLAGVAARGPLSGRARSGLGFVSEERSVFMSLTAAENLRVGRCDVDHALALFPELEALLGRRAGLLSGGEQQMLTLARALARRPKVLLADELSLGLAPLVVERLLQAVRAAADEGVAVLLVEQHIRKALKIADHVLVMRRGKVVLEGSGADLRGRTADIEAAYMAAAA